MGGDFIKKIDDMMSEGLVAVVFSSQSAMCDRYSNIAYPTVITKPSSVYNNAGAGFHV